MVAVEMVSNWRFEGRVNRSCREGEKEGDRVKEGRRLRMVQSAWLEHLKEQNYPFAVMGKTVEKKIWGEKSLILDKVNVRYAIGV